MRPNPITPSVLPCSSTPVSLRFQPPALVEASASGTRRATASSRAKVCSVAESRLAVGALTTTPPCSVAAATSTLSTPMPARPTTFSRLAACSSSAVTLVALRTTSASKAPMISARRGRSASLSSTISAPESASRARPEGASGSAIRMRCIASGFMTRPRGCERRGGVAALGAELADLADLYEGVVDLAQQRLEVGLADLAHVDDAEGARLPFAVAAADGPAPAAEPLDQRLRIDAPRWPQGGARVRAGAFGRRERETAGRRPFGGAPVEPLMARPARLHALGEDARQLPVQGVEQRDRRRGDGAALAVLVAVAQQVGVEAAPLHAGGPLGGALRQPEDDQAGRQRQRLLGAGECHVQAPGVGLDRK